jgi:hypothetical protein
VPIIEKPGLLTESQAARMLRQSVRTLRDWRLRPRTAPRLPYLKLGRSVRYDPSDVVAYLRRCKRESSVRPRKNSVMNGTQGGA